MRKRPVYLYEFHALPIAFWLISARMADGFGDFLAHRNSEGWREPPLSLQEVQPMKTILTKS
jgi:hypothetical protein